MSKIFVKSKRAELGNLQGIITTLIVVGILLGIAFMLLQAFADQATGVAQEGVNETIDALMTVPEWLGIIVLISIVGIILAIVFAVLPRAGAGGTI